MALPKIKPYTYVDREHSNRVSWPVDPSRAVLLVHDMQVHFVQAFEAAHAAGIPVYYTAQPPRQNPEDRRLLIDFWGDGLQNDESARVLDELAPTDRDTVLTKWRYSAFVRSPFEDLLKESGRDQLIIGGVYAHIGCLTTALEAFMRDIQPFMVADALADFSEEEHRTACEYASGRCARVLNTADVLADLQAAETAEEARA